MNTTRRRGSPAFRKRGVVAVQVAVFSVILIGFAALTLDIGVMYNTRADLQRTADSAALAAASRLSVYTDGSPVEIARDVAQEFTERNSVLGNTVTIDPTEDVVFGRASFDVDANDYTFTPNDELPDAVQVRVRHTADSPNGSVSLYFARVFGLSETELSASALAVMVPRDIAIVADLSGSHNDDSELFHYPLTEVNIFEVWDNLPGGTDDVAACTGVACGPGQTCVGGICTASGPGAQAGPTWGYMDELGFGHEVVDPSYNPTTDPGLIRLAKSSNWSDAQLTTYLNDRGYNAAEQAAIMSSSFDGSGAWPYRTAVALGLAYWNSGIAGGLWQTRGAPPGNANNNVQSTELEWSESIMGRTVTTSKSIWLDYINNYVNQTWTKPYSVNTNFRYRFGIKSFMTYLLERRSTNSQTPEFVDTPIEPMQAVRNAVSYMSEVLEELDTDDQVSLEIYGTTARHEVDLTHDHSQISTRIQEMQSNHYDSYTNTGGGIYKGITELTSVRARGSSRKVMVVLTDGNANCNASGSCGTSEDDELEGNQFAMEAAQAAADLGIRIFAVSVGADSNSTLMAQIADIGQGEHFHAAGTIDEYSAELRDIFERISGRRPVELIR